MGGRLFRNDVLGLGWSMEQSTGLGPVNLPARGRRTDLRLLVLRDADALVEVLQGWSTAQGLAGGARSRGAWN